MNICSGDIVGIMRNTYINVWGTFFCSCYCSRVSWTWENRWCRLITVTDNSQSHRFSLSKYSRHSVIYICRIFKAHQNKHAHALAEIIDAFEPSECHDLRLFPLSNGNQIFPGCSITYPILLHLSGLFVCVQSINGIGTGFSVQIQCFSIFAFKTSGNQELHYLDNTHMRIDSLRLRKWYN